MQPDAWPMAIIFAIILLVIAWLIEKSETFKFHLRDERFLVLWGFTTFMSGIVVMFALYDFLTFGMFVVFIGILLVLRKVSESLREYVKTLFILSVIGFPFGIVFRFLLEL